MFIECCISSPEYVSIKLFGLQPQRFLPVIASWCLVHLKNDVEISTDIPDRQNETHDSKTYVLSRHPYMANTDHSPRNSQRKQHLRLKPETKRRQENNVLHRSSCFEWR